MSEAFDRIKKILIKQLNVDEANITEDAFFVDDLGADSIDIVELVMAIETEFGIEIPEDELENFQRVGDVLHYIESVVK